MSERGGVGLHVNVLTKVIGATNRVWKERMLCMIRKRVMYENIVVPTPLCVTEIWGPNKKREKSLECNGNEVLGKYV